MSLCPSPEIWLRLALRSTEASSDIRAFHAWMEAEAAVTDQRTAQGPLNAQKYSVRVEAGIRRAIGHLPANGVRVKVADVLDAIEAKGPAFYGLERTPDKDTVRAVQRKMEAERDAVLLSVGTGPQGCEPWVSITQGST